MPVILQDDQADQMIRLLRELVEQGREKKKPPRKRMAVERNRADVVANSQPSEAMMQLVRRKMTRATRTV
jgi:hypothetical protein